MRIKVMLVHTNILGARARAGWQLYCAICLAITQDKGSAKTAPRAAATMMFCAVPMFALRMTTTPIPANVVPAIAKIIIVRRTILASIRNVNAASHIPALQHLMQVSAKDTGTTQRHACARLKNRH